MTLRKAARGKFLIGCAVSARDFDNRQLANLIGDQFDCLTPGNEMKPESLQPEPGKFTFAVADHIVDFAHQHGMKVIGHTLLWHHQSPKFLFADEDGHPLSRERALQNLKIHIETVVKHFRGKVLGWDVVNEALSDDANEYLRDTPARRAIGDDYVVKAFEFARAADPNVQLYYNDYNIDADYKRAKAIRLIKELKSAGCRVDAIGIQGHWGLDRPPIAEIETGIRELGSLGPKLMITELDVDVLPRKKISAEISATETEGLDPYKTGLPESVQHELARRYADLFRLFSAHRETITRVTLWGVYDGNSWLDNFPVHGRTNHPLLWDRHLRAKLALQAALNALEAR